MYLKDSLSALRASIVLGLISAFGDWLWTHYLEDGAILPGVIHGMVIFAVFAATLAFHAGTSRAWRVLMIGLPPAGLLIAAVFYPIAWVTGYLPALLITWAGMWLVLALLQRIARGKSEALKFACSRGFIAAVGSGLAFWSVSHMWTAPAPGGPNYALHFVYWTFAFLPGFLALMVGLPAPVAETEET